MAFHIRQATLEDLGLLCELRIEVIHAVFKIPDTEDLTALKQASEAYYRRAIPAGTHIACLLSCQDELAGCGAFCLQEEMPSPDNPTGLCAFLMNIYVRPAYRGKGAGAEAVNWLIEHAQKMGATKVYLETTAEAQTLYKECGFVELRDFMILPHID